MSSSKSLLRLGLVSTFLALGTVTAAGCAGEEPGEEMGESEGFLLSGRVVKAAEVADHLRAAGFQENIIGKMTCVAKWESSFFERAQNGRHRGLYQISSLHLGSKGCPKNADDLFTAETNIKCAFAVFQKQGIKAWEAYGKHKAECDRFPAPKSSGRVDAGRDAGSDDDDDDDDNRATDPRDRSGEVGRGSDADVSEEDVEGGGCFSGTLQTMVGPHACVQSKSSRIWFQCSEGKWFRGGNATSGPFGQCTDSFPL